MRQLCNVAYVVQVEHMESKDIRKFDKELNAAPGKPVSHGTSALMSLMGGQATQQQRPGGQRPKRPVERDEPRRPPASGGRS